MTNNKHFDKSLSRTVKGLESTIPYAIETGYPSISVDMSLEVAQEVVNTVRSYQTFEAYLTQRIAKIEADKKGQTTEVKAVLNGVLVELAELKDKLGEIDGVPSS
ncbi:hypothetical protein OH460_07990 [Vibrio sp. Makdt]|uniref:hypothetical protein n=1 Tax=Vibrio sp. Makdt TaxID=2998828 RepID=UPI0022CDB2AA|nr:hypothetical protein [Vibrio sp. Makdt]MDA0152238.1 hypothetical protein [Vibrio sp. Makdt]